ncbi:putative Endonuclease Exonuclease phosphatase family [Trypanosoma vivax]|uniref:Endonuclease/exonuclease/phosphatase domain-containing protein n=1 Tax=Trypanosoma vivax (strain Y486) TaxID=1055687 RepID=G0U1Z7_TRYVY|nr:hypothetical protein TRVL_04413 [Trypanosoma vivax]KAH8618710.1 putative Endonuclease Exonuclease phosphatase family [Trypanosoma vivax]CCC50299.1 conserved hypothetical protein [Trypanosoma vivax Y486]
MFGLTTLRLSSSVTGGPVQGLQAGVRTLIQPCLAEDLQRDAVMLRRRAAELAQLEPDKEAPAYKPPLPRAWVKAPMSRLSTSLSRRDWFRLMQFNMMTDVWNVPSATTASISPVHGVRPYVPGFTRKGADPNAFFPYDNGVDTDVPAFLRQDFRRAFLVNEIGYYDPDIVCLHEVNRSFFNDVLLKYVRYRGYGTLYQSSRGYGVRALRKGDDPSLPRHKGKIGEMEDIGNVVLFHKGRFVPILMPGKDLVQNLHFAHIVSMRDRVTNMTLNVACVQYTAGDSAEAEQIRLHEARQTLQVLDAIHRNDTDRAHMSSVVCGDFNNVGDDDASVQFMHERFFSTYDVVGGPRWTTWFHEDPAASERYAKYFACNRVGYERSDASKRAKREVAAYTRLRNIGKGAGKVCASGMELVGEQLAPVAPEGSSTERQGAESLVMEQDVKHEERPSSDGGVCEDMLMVRKQAMKAAGIVQRTQDFIFYDPQTLALHQVLDVPEEQHVDEQQLLPCSRHPSHHIHLVVDVSFTDPFPDVGEKSLKN